MSSPLKPCPIGVPTRALRMFGMIAGLAVSLVTTVSLTLFLAWLMWFALAELRLENLPFYPHSWYIYNPPPAIPWVAERSAKLMVAMMLLFGCLDLLVPMSQRIKACTGIAPIKLPADHAASIVANALSKRSGGGKVGVWLLPINGISAFALTGPLWNSKAVVMSTDVMMSAPSEIRDWIIAHEIGHLVHKDSRASSIWIFFFRSVRLFMRVRLLIARFALQFVYRLPVLKHLAFTLYSLIRIVLAFGCIGRASGVLVFKIADSYASRKMEFAADEFAFKAYGAKPGILAFTALNGSYLEPGFGLFATHPANEERIQRLLHLEAQSGAKEFAQQKGVAAQKAPQ